LKIYFILPPIIMGGVYEQYLGYPHPLFTGAVHNLAFDMAGDASRLIKTRLDKLISATENQAQDSDVLTEEIMGELLYIAGLKYLQDTEAGINELASLKQYIINRRIWSAMTIQKVKPVTLAGQPTCLELTTNLINAAIPDAFSDALFAIDGGTSTRGAIRKLSMMNSSFHEHNIWEDVVGIEAISTIKALQYAKAAGITIHTIDASNLSEIDRLNLSAQRKQELKEELDVTRYPGYRITIPHSEFSYRDWTGMGYIWEHAEAGCGAYFISGQVAGGETVKKEALRIALLAPKEKVFKVGQPINCKAEAFGVDGKSISNKISWSVLGEGEGFSTGTGTGYSFTPTKVGDYNIIATVHDDQGHTAMVNVRVKAGYGTEHNQYDKIIGAATKNKDVKPEVVKGMIHQESAFKPYAYNSESGAKGLCQLTKPAVTDINKEYDPDIKISDKPIDSTHPDWPNSIWNPEVNIKGGARFLQMKYNEFSDVPDTPQNRDRTRFALGAYNAGPRYIKRAKKMAEKKGLEKTDWDSIVWIGENEEVRVKKDGKEWDHKQTIDYVDKIIGRNGAMGGYALKYDP
jgi:hypothetical protein